MVVRFKVNKIDTLNFTIIVFKMLYERSRLTLRIQDPKLRREFRTNVGKRAFSNLPIMGTLLALSSITTIIQVLSNNGQAGARLVSNVGTWVHLISTYLILKRWPIMNEVCG